MARQKYNDVYEYEIFDDGYDIYSNNILVITQHGPFGRPYDSSKSYEENCIMQLDDLTREPEPPKPGPLPPTPEELLRADVDFIALVEGLELPSQDVASEEEGE